MKIALGTVQFGFDYGVSNTVGKVTRCNARKILKFAHESKIKTIDTSTMYGDSEKVVGEFTNHDFNIVTKTQHFHGNSINNGHINQLIDGFNGSLLNLHRGKLYGLLVHSCKDLLKPGGSLLFKEMERLKNNGFVDKIGVSVYNKEQIDIILDNFKIDLIQLPVSILNQSLINNSSLYKLKLHDVEIHVRSVFLQGLLLMKKELLPKYFLPIEKKIDLFHSMAKELSLTNLELALAFVANIDEVDEIVVGVNSIDQLKEVVEASKLKIKLDNLRNLSVDNPIYTNPSLWNV